MKALELSFIEALQIKASLHSLDMLIKSFPVFTCGDEPRLMLDTNGMQDDDMATLCECLDVDASPSNMSTLRNQFIMFYN